MNTDTYIQYVHEANTHAYTSNTSIFPRVYVIYVYIPTRIRHIRLCTHAYSSQKAGRSHQNRKGAAEKRATCCASEHRHTDTQTHTPDSRATCCAGAHRHTDTQTHTQTHTPDSRATCCASAKAAGSFRTLSFSCSAFFLPFLAFLSCLRFSCSCAA